MHGAPYKAIPNQLEQIAYRHRRQGLLFNALPEAERMQAKNLEIRVCNECLLSFVQPEVIQLRLTGKRGNFRRDNARITKTSAPICATGILL